MTSRPLRSTLIALAIGLTWVGSGAMSAPLRAAMQSPGWEIWEAAAGTPHLRIESLPDTPPERFATLMALAWCDTAGFIEAAGRDDVRALAQQATFREICRAGAHGLADAWLPLPAETGALKSHDATPREESEMWRWAARVSALRKADRTVLAGAFSDLPALLKSATSEDPTRYLDSAPGRAARAWESQLADFQDKALRLRISADLAYLELLPIAREAFAASRPREGAPPETSDDEGGRGPGGGMGSGDRPGMAPGPRDESAPARDLGGEGPWDYWVYYGTNRAPVDEDDPDEGFANVPDPRGRLHRGRCKVLIPETHQFGELGSDDWSWLPFVDDDALKLLETKRLARMDFLSELRAALADVEVGQRDIVVYVHGYNNDFEEAALRAAQIGFDLKVPGPMAFFSWPSNGTVGGYDDDGLRVKDSIEALETYLRELALQTGAEQLHLIVHSMGNRGMAAAMERLAVTADVRFGQVILAAPDITPERFAEVAAAYVALSKRTTLYVSARDLALSLSQWINDGPRAGYTPPVTVAPQVDTVEVTEIDLTALGHSYYAEAEAVLYDIHELLRSGRAPAERLRVRPVTDVGYWRIAP